VLTPKHSSVSSRVAGTRAKMHVANDTTAAASSAGGADVVALFRMSIESVATLLLQYLAGGVAGYFHVVAEADVRTLSNIMNIFLVPCLSIASLGRGLNVDVFTQGGWVLVAIGFVSSIAYAFIGLGIRFIARPQPEFSRLFIVMLAIPNVVAIPIALSQSLCQYGAFDAEFHGDRRQCAERAMAYTFLYVSLDAINSFVIAVSYLSADSPVSQSGGSGSGGDTALGHESGVGKPSSSATLPAAVHVTIAPRSPLQAARQQACSLLRRPPVVAMFVGLTVGLVAPLQRALFSDSGALSFVGSAVASLAAAGVPIINLMVAFSLGHKLRSLPRWSDLLGSAEVGISPRTLLVLTLGRMVIVPLLDGLLLYSMFGILPASRLLRVVLFIEMAPPTASIVVLLTHLAKKPALAQLCAFALVPQYLLVPLTLTATLVIALSITA
jgi:predicted permease